MNNERKFGRLSAVITSVGLLGILAGCPMAPEPPTGPQAFLDASSARGGQLYDKFWEVAGMGAPTTDHPLWASRPDTTSNTRTGADTWRCKECHGWDYKGVSGAYGSGSHKTGIAGIFGTTKTPNEVFDLLHTDHAYGDAGFGLGDANIWDLVKFVLEGQTDTDTMIDANGAFTGTVATGQTLYDNGIGSSFACAICHGADGLTIEFAPGEFLGTLAADNPWELQHKVRFGQPGTSMPAAVDVNATNVDVANVGAFAQTLPVAP